MIRFLIKGLLRDRSRSLFPFMVVVAGVMLTVVMQTYITGAISGMVWSNASLQSGHVKVMSAAYAAEADQVPNDLALMGIDTLLQALRREFPELIWTPRIRFGGLLDIPDSTGETRAQGPAFGLGIDMLDAGSPEHQILNLEQALIRGRLPAAPGEVLISDQFARRVNLRPGETLTLISATMFGSMALQNFTVAGTVRFGVSAIDRGALIADLADVQAALDMRNAAGEILGYFPDFQFHEQRAAAIKQLFNTRFQNPDDEFAPVLLTLREQQGMGELLDMYGMFVGIILAIFVSVMFVVLWNAGLMGSLRRYGEIGVRLAMGEPKGHVYRSMLLESLFLSIFGTIVGTSIGLAIAYFLQVKGIDYGSMMKASSMLMSSVIRAQITPVSYVIGFIPGIGATLLGTAVSGIGIYKRQTSQLFKELEV